MGKNTIGSLESGHDTRGNSPQRSLCDGHILVLCIVPFRNVAAFER
jgi:hypothetical protein